MSLLPSSLDHQHLHLPPRFRFPMYVCLLTRRSDSEVPYHRMNCGRLIVNEELRGLARCMCTGYPKAPKNLLLMLELNRLPPYWERDVATLGHWPTLSSSFRIFTLAFTGLVCLLYIFLVSCCKHARFFFFNFESAKLLTFSGLWLAD